MAKKIESKNDLAVNGAPPAFDKPLHVGHPNIGDRERFLHYVNGIFDSGRLTNNGPLVRDFEARIQEYLNVGHCVAMCNGTVALEIAIRALELKGEVIIPSYTFVATAHALHWQEITPVFADINSETHSLDPDAVRSMITPKTTGIIGVHLWGRACDVEGLQEVADEYNLKLMFDAAHAFGCSYKQKVIGGFGACEVLSFHATKCLNTFEGGAVVTNDVELAEKMKLMRNFGFSGYDNVIYPGTNGKMSEISAAMGLTNLGALGEFVAASRHNYETYRAYLKDIPGVTILPYNEKETNNYQYVVIEIDPEQLCSRDELVRILHAENILVRRYFWPGCHKMKPYCDLYPHSGLLLTNTATVAERVIVLPTGIATDSAMVATIASVFNVLGRNGA